jgi:hypothetical protein
MSRGIGALQRTILSELRYDHGQYPEDERGLWMVQLADFICAEIRQTRRAVRSLEERGLVAVEKRHGFSAPIGQRGSALLVRITSEGLES